MDRAKKGRLRGAAKVYSDGTVCRNLRRSFPEKYFGADLDNILGRAAELALKGRMPAEAYKEVFAALHTATGCKKVVIVLDNLADYNPLRLDGIKDSCGYHSKEQLQRYADAFARLLPNSVTVEVIGIADLQPPDANTFVLVHHHALHKHPAGADLQSNPRVLMPYAQGFIPGVNALCDISGIVDDAIVPAQQVIQDRRMW